MMRDQKKMKKRERGTSHYIYARKIKESEKERTGLYMYDVVLSGLAVILSLGDATKRFDARTRTFTQGFFKFFSYTRRNNMNK